nr:MAG TPA: hypothetical protein [Caudoviricetes sp.]
MILAIGCAQMIAAIIAQIGLNIHTDVQNGRVEKMIRCFLIIANIVICLLMLISTGVASDSNEKHNGFFLLATLTVISAFNAAYILFC